MHSHIYIYDHLPMTTLISIFAPSPLFSSLSFPYFLFLSHLFYFLPFPLSFISSLLPILSFPSLIFSSHLFPSISLPFSPLLLPSLFVAFLFFLSLLFSFFPVPSHFFLFPNSLLPPYLFSPRFHFLFFPLPFSTSSLLFKCPSCAH